MAELKRKRRSRAAEREAGSDVQSESEQAADESDAECKVAHVWGTRGVRLTERGYRQSRVLSLGSGALSLSLNLTRHCSRFHSLYDKTQRRHGMTYKMTLYAENE